VLGLGNAGQALGNLKRSSECVVNLPSASLWRQIEAIAPTTGRPDVPDSKRAMGYTYERDKWARGGLASLPSQTVKPLRIAACPLQLEARLASIHTPSGAATGEPGWNIVELQVPRVPGDDSILDDDDRIDMHRWKPLFYVFRNYVAAGELLGQNFRAATKGRVNQPRSPKVSAL
jgi:flavin reductase (DIM6/NTAB) family NADH-FMN oxidoreductase RutF